MEETPQDGEIVQMEDRPQSSPEDDDKNLEPRLLSSSLAGDGMELRHVIAHSDLDCFYVAVEQQRNPELRGKPCGVVQYNPYGDLRTIAPSEHRIVNDSNGSIIAVGYEARAFGVKRVMSGDEARRVCPGIQLIQVPTKHGKADLTIYRAAGAKVLDIMSRYGVCERASIDEAYCDLSVRSRVLLQKWDSEIVARARRSRIAGMETKVLSKMDIRLGHVQSEEEELPEEKQEQLSEHMQENIEMGESLKEAAGEKASNEQAFWDRPIGSWSIRERLLVCGTALMTECREAVEAELGYTLSSGIAPCKLLAKLASGMHKPNMQTLVLAAMIPMLLDPLPIARIKGLGGDFGFKVSQDLQVQTIGQLAAIPLTKLEHMYGEKEAQWLWKISRGIDEEPVIDRRLAKSTACGKTFYGGNNLRTYERVQHWLGQLCSELTERLAADCLLNDRLPQLLTVSFQAQLGNASTVRLPPNFLASDAADGKQKYNSQNVSRSAPVFLSLDQLEFRPGDVQRTLTETGLILVKRWQTQREETHTGPGKPPILCLSTLYVTAGNYSNVLQKSKLSHFFHRAPASVRSSPQSEARPLDPSSSPSSSSNTSTCAAAGSAISPPQTQRSADTTTQANAPSARPGALPFTIRKPSDHASHDGDVQGTDAPSSENSPVVGKQEGSLAELGASGHVMPCKRRHVELEAEDISVVEVSQRPGEGMTGTEAARDGNGAKRFLQHERHRLLCKSSRSSVFVDPREVDRAVLNELPVDIQRELLGAMRRVQMVSEGKKGIEQYLSRKEDRGKVSSTRAAAKDKHGKGQLDQYFRKER